MMDPRKRLLLRDFLVVAAIQAVGFPLVSRIFGLGDRLHAPSWVVIVLVSGLMAALADAARRHKQDGRS